jgi:hypothetical protein
MQQAIEEYASHRYAQNVLGAVLKAELDGQAAVVVLVDRDRRDNRETIAPLRAGRDAAARDSNIPCVVGQAVESFDAWMVADGKAIGAAGGSSSISHPKPEQLQGKEGTGDHPKDLAARIFGGSQGLGAKYAQVAAVVSIDVLKKACPDGFAPFAKEVEERLLPVVGTNS